MLMLYIYQLIKHVFMTNSGHVYFGTFPPNCTHDVHQPFSAHNKQGNINTRVQVYKHSTNHAQEAGD